MISAYRWFGRHPLAWLVPAVLLVLLTGAQVLVSLYGEVLVPAPFFTSAQVWLALWTTGSLITSRARWIRNEVLAEVNHAGNHTSNAIADLQAAVESLKPAPEPAVPKAYQNPRIWPTQPAVYGRRIAGAKDLGEREVLEQLDWNAPTAAHDEHTGDISREESN
jgi:hypothetical protein